MSLSSFSVSMNDSVHLSKPLGAHSGHAVSLLASAEILYWESPVQQLPCLNRRSSANLATGY